MGATPPVRRVNHRGCCGSVFVNISVGFYMWYEIKKIRAVMLTDEDMCGIIWSW